MIRFVHPTLEGYRKRTPLPGRVVGGRRANGGPPKTDLPGVPLVTIVTAIFNGERLLRRTIESVLSQTYSNVEFVLMDGASKDGSVDILRSYGDALDYWVSERDQSMFDGMNRGIAAASGSIVKILGADDLMAPDAVAAAVGTFLQHGGPCVVRSAMDLIDDDDRLITCVQDHVTFRYMPAILHPTWFVPMSVYEAHGLYDPNAVVASDCEMYFHLVQRGVPFVKSQTVLTQFRTGGTSTATWHGFVDGVLINWRYQGPAIASYLAIVTGTRTLASRGLQAVIGKQRLDVVKRAIRRQVA